MRSQKVFLMVSLALTPFLVSHATAGDSCAHCGCGECEQVCRLVREDKKVNITCWGCKCEDFCAPGKSCRGCKNCQEVCDEDCNTSDVCAAPKKFVWFDWEPGCAHHIYTKKKLMRKTIEKKIPSYKWIVEDICPHCQSKCQCALIEPGAQIPAPPQVAGRIIGGIAVEGEPQEEIRPAMVPISTKNTSQSMLKSLFGK